MGKIYFLHAPKSQMLKIGYTSRLKERITVLRNNSPEPLTLLKTIDGSKYTEAALLSIFSEFRTHGEWFKADPVLLDYIESLDPEPFYTPQLLIKK